MMNCLLFVIMECLALRLHFRWRGDLAPAALAMAFRSGMGRCLFQAGSRHNETERNFG